MLAIWKRELQGYFKTPVGYVFMGCFLLVGGLMFFFANLTMESGNIAGMLAQFTTALMVLVPVLTMRLFSEDRKNRTEQLLLTSPLPLTGIVLGKYFAAVTVFSLTLAATGVYVAIIHFYGSVYWGETLTAYLGFFLMGCSYIAVGVLISCMTENQVSAAVATFGACFFLWIADSAISVVPIQAVSSVLSWLSIFTRYEPFTRAQLGVSGVVYFLSLSAVLLFLSVRVMEKRRWSEG